tara:strand:- start:827 stop:1504 length:678 start_codon:yes stop_codon:yes gene_type:complete
MSSKKSFIFSLFFFITLYSCKVSQNYFPHNEGKQVFYDIFFQDKEGKKKKFKQGFFFLPKTKNSIPVLKSDGELTFYEYGKHGISMKNMEEFLSPNQDLKPQLFLAFPIKENVEWEVDDKTTIQMKLGYDRFYNTDLPFKLKNKIISTNDKIKIQGKEIENCVKVLGYGNTSYYPDPTLGNINIEIFTTTWFAKGLGLLKYKREERSDSETMGTIIYEKTLILED